MSEVNIKRLKTARLFKGKTIEQLAKETGIVKKDLLCFEDSRYAPRDENIYKLAKALNFPKSYFYQDDVIKVNIDNSFSKTQGLSNKLEEISIKEKLLMLHKFHIAMIEHTTFPELNLPDSSLKFSSVDDLASKCRTILRTGNGPIKSMVNVMESNGIIIWDKNVSKKGVVTLTQKHTIGGEVQYLIALGNDNKCLALRNYDLAYELGNILGNILKIPSKQMPKDEFACAFLLPYKEFVKDLKTPENLDAYVELKKKWMVPISTMIFRAHAIGLINYKLYNSLMIDMEKRGWLTKEPLDESMKDTSTILIRAFMQSFIDKHPGNGSIIMNTLKDYGMTLIPDEVELLVGLKKESLLKF